MTLLAPPRLFYLNLAMSRGLARRGMMQALRDVTFHRVLDS
jgi:hypothetical protein